VGEKCPQISLTEMQHGNAIPLSNFFDFLLLNTFYNSSSMKLSIVPQIVETSAPSTESSIAFSRAAK
jgi:hypothetical protein